MTNIYDFARAGDVESLIESLDQNKIQLEDIEQDTNSTLLGVAVAHGNIETVKMLIDRGANIHTLGDDDWTLVHKACYQGHEEMVTILIEKGVDCNKKDITGWTALSHSCADGNKSMAELLINAGTDKESVDLDHWTPLHIVVDCGDSEGHLAVAQLLLEYGWDVNKKDKNGETPIHRACTKGHSNIAQLLLRAGADVNATDDVGWSGLHIAATKDHASVIEVLIENKANCEQEDAKGWTPLLVAAVCGHFSSVSSLIKKGANVNSNAKDFTTALYLACAKGHDMIARALLDAGADAEARVGTDELTALHIATARSQMLCSLTLISKGANIEAVDINGLTVLHRAAAKGLVDIVQMLLDHGCDPLAKARFGSIAVDFAKDRKHEAVVDLLVKQANQPPSAPKVKPLPPATRPAAPLVATRAVPPPPPPRKREPPALSTAQAMSDLEAARAAATQEDETNIPNAIRKMARAIAEENSRMNRNSTKIADAVSLPPTLYSEVLRVRSEVAQEVTHALGTLTLAELRDQNVAALIGFDVANKEKYLKDVEFVKYLGMARAEFAQLPKWKRDHKKREVGLF